MADDVEKFVNSDVMFIECPRFSNELLTLVHTTGDSVEKALSMSGEYLSGIGDVGGIFQESVATCSELSSQITRLANKTGDLSRDEIKSLLDMEKRSMRTFNRMESQWKRIVRKAQIGEDTVVFFKLNSQVQAAQFIIKQTHTPYRTDRFRGSSPVITTLSGPGDHTEGTPENDGNKNAVFHVRGVVTAVQTGEGVTTQTNYGENSINRTNMADDKPDGLRRSTSDVVQRQHTTDEAVTFLRPLQKKNCSTFQSTERIPKPVNPTDVVQRQDVCLNHQGHPMPLTTDGDRLIPAQTVHQKEG